MKDIIVVTGGAGFIGSSLIEYLLNLTKKKIISVDDYSSGTKKNQIINKRVQYIKGNTSNIEKYLSKYKKSIDAVFHFGEFSRIYQSFLKLNQCYLSNSIGTHAVFNFCLKNKIRVIYSATSASLGKLKNKSLSPYAFTKQKNIEYLENLHRWFNFKFDVIYFYNVYGPKQISTGDMATVVGIFENCYFNNKPIPVVRPGTQTRRFTHIYDTIEACMHVYNKNACKHYIITNKKEYSILQLAKFFNTKIKYLKKRPGERYFSALTKININRKIIKIFGKRDIKHYVQKIIGKK